MRWWEERKTAMRASRLAKDAHQPGPGAANPGPVNFATARQVVVLFPADDAEQRKAVAEWKAKKQRGTRKIHLFGCFKRDFGAAKFDFPAIGPKERNWYGLPRGEVTDRIRGLACDLLISLGDRPDHRLDYLAAISPARMKAGPAHVTPIPIYQIQFDASTHRNLVQQLAAVEAIFNFTNAKPTSL